MHTSAASDDPNSRDADPVEQKALDLIRRFNDADHTHVLRGIFKDTDSFTEIIAKQRQAATKINCALAELVALKTVLEFIDQSEERGPGVKLRDPVPLRKLC